MKLKPLEEQVVVVFGASSGIGRETALRFGREGARVVVAARDSEGLESVAEEIRRAGGEAHPVQAEATDFAQVKAVADAAVNTFGHLDTWVHVAAVTQYARFDETTPDEFRRIVDVNLTGAAYGVMAALPHLKSEGRGALILVSSVEGKYALPLQSAYSASKHGLEGMAKSLRLELQRDALPISVTTILPSSTNTPLFDVARTKLGVKPKGFPPIYQPHLTAEATLYAATHLEREIVVGGAGKALAALNRISPRLADAAVARKAFWLQRTTEERPAEAPNNLYEPVPGHARVEGSYTGRARPFSIYTWLRLHPGLRYGLGALLLSGLAFAVIGPTTVLTGARSLGTTAMAALPFRRRRLRRGLGQRAAATIAEVQHAASTAIPEALSESLAMVTMGRLGTRKAPRGLWGRLRGGRLSSGLTNAWYTLQVMRHRMMAAPPWKAIGIGTLRTRRGPTERASMALSGMARTMRGLMPASIIDVTSLTATSWLRDRGRRRRH